jgi:hypothetical protein
MRLRSTLIASTALVGLAIGCNMEPPYNTLVETPPGGDPPVRRPVMASKGKARPPKPPITQTLRKIDVDGAKPIAK